MCQWEDKLYYYKRHRNRNGSSILKLYKLTLSSYEESLVDGYDIDESVNIELNSIFSQ